MKLANVAIVNRTRTNLRSGVARATREGAGVTEAQMAEQLGVSEDSVLWWESGKITPAADDALAYGTRLRDLRLAAKRCPVCEYRRDRCVCRPASPGAGQPAPRYP